jgi:SAM-dependent methyltransferase
VHDSAEGEPTRRGYDTVAREYATEIADELAGKPLDRAVLDVVVELAAGGPIADIGCGPGHLAAHLADRGASVVGVDQSEAMCALASRATSLPSCVADMTALSIRSQSLAAIVTLYSVIHLNTPGRAAAYQEFARTLRIGGTRSSRFTPAMPTCGWVAAGHSPIGGATRSNWYSDSSTRPRRSSCSRKSD